MIFIPIITNKLLNIIVSGLLFGAFIAMIFVSRPIDFKKMSQSKRIVISSISLVSALVIGIIAWHINVFNELLPYINIILTLSLIARLSRVFKSQSFTKNALNQLTLIDIIITTGIAIVMVITAKGIGETKTAFVSYSVGFPLIYFFITLYFIYVSYTIAPSQVKASYWQLTTYAFPSQQKQQTNDTEKISNAGVTAIELIKSTMVVLAIILILLFSYKLARHDLFFILFTAVSIIAGILFLFIKPISRRIIKSIRQIIAFFFVSSIFVWLIFLYYGITSYSSDEIGMRVFRAAVYAVPLISTIAFLTDFLNSDRLSITHITNKHNSVVSLINALATSIRTTILGEKHINKNQTYVIAFLFIFYFGFPKSEPLLQYFDLEVVLGVPIDHLIHEFEIIARNWVVPDGYSKQNILLFVMGNQGIVLLFIVWSISTIFRFINADLSMYLNKIPIIKQSKNKFFITIHFILLLPIIVPFLLILSLLIPYTLSLLFDEQASILLGVLGFSLIIPRLLALFLAPFYLLFLYHKISSSKY